MAASAGFLNAVLDLYFTNVSHAEIGDATGLVGSTGAGSFYISLHTGDPVAGTQTTSEATFGSYTRQAVARSGAGFTVAAANVSNAAAVSFPQGSSGTETITHFAIGENDTPTAGTVFMTGALDTSRAAGTGITLEFAIGELDVDLT
jgi:hypothetical protein